MAWPILEPMATLPMETSLQPSPEQDAIITTRRADPGGSLRVVAFAGSGKTTALRLLAVARQSKWDRRDNHEGNLQPRHAHDCRGAAVLQVLS